MDIVGWILGAIGILTGLFGIFDARKQRAKVERLAQHQSETIHNLRGFLLAVKGWAVIDLNQVNDRLEFIRQREEQFNSIADGKS